MSTSPDETPEVGTTPPVEGKRGGRRDDWGWKQFMMIFTACACMSLLRGPHMRKLTSQNRPSDSARNAQSQDA